MRKLRIIHRSYLLYTMSSQYRHSALYHIVRGFPNSGNSSLLVSVATIIIVRSILSERKKGIRRKQTENEHSNFGTLFIFSKLIIFFEYSYESHPMQMWLIVVVIHDANVYFLFKQNT